jgi:RNA polymerase sigma-70 factor (ECF subfamily)
LASPRALPSGTVSAQGVGLDDVSADERFAGFVRTHQDVVFAVAVRLMGRADAAREVALEVFLMAYPHHGALAPEAAPQWLRRVAQRACLNRLAQRRPRWAWPSRGSGLSEAHPPVDDDADRGLEPLERAVRRLPDALRVPFVLFHLEQVSYEAIADALGAPVAKVRIDVQRGRDALRGFVSPDGTG